jgi:hypothetical protein
MQESGSLRNLLDIWEELAPRERRALTLYARRISRGQQLFGKLTKDKKNWAKETVEEAIDASVYLTALAIDLEDRDDG